MMQLDSTVTPGTVVPLMGESRKGRALTPVP